MADHCSRWIYFSSQSDFSAMAASILFSSDISSQITQLEINKSLDSIQLSLPHSSSPNHLDSSTIYQNIQELNWEGFISGIIHVVKKLNKSSISKPRNGLGTNAYPDGRIYVGEFKEGSFHGQGIYSWPDGCVYVGEFKNGNRNGEGTLTRPEGKVQNGRWENTKLVAC